MKIGPETEGWKVLERLSSGNSVHRGISALISRGVRLY